MITIEQLKDVKERTAALERYLDIENKLVQVEEEQLRTQAPGFWDDAKKAEAQMRKVKDLQKWIDGYREVKTMADELELAFECNRWFDLCRRHILKETLEAYYPEAKIDDHNYLLPKPSDQMTIMTGIVQNPGYN